MSTKVVFHFDDKLEFQYQAIQSVVGLFNGQNKELGDVIYRGAMKHIRLLDQDPIRNRLDLGQTKILNNLRDIQHHNSLFPSDDMSSQYNFTVEMETGTGKTYVYLRTILELFKTYNFMKFLIVVPSIAIRKGIDTSIQMLNEHFKTLYDGLDLNKYCFVYDSSNRNKIKEFAEARDLRIAIMNIQAFNRESTIIRKEDEMGLILWDLLHYVKPIVIIDEPQKIEGTSKKKSSSLKALEELDPLFTLRYSATHKKLYNQIYKLDSYQAYKQNLVKKIEVKTVYGDVSKDFPYVRYIHFTKELKARIEIFKSDPKIGTHLGMVDVKKSNDLFELSGGLNQYKNWIVREDPHKQNGLHIGIGNKDDLHLLEGENNYNRDDDFMIRIQIRLTIQRHLEKQLHILEKGHRIKVLSLFFIDSVKHFRDTGSDDSRGKFARIFDEEYARVIQDSRYNKVFTTFPELFPQYKVVQAVREGYFAIDKSKKETDIADWDWSKDETTLVAKSQEDIDRGIQLILEKKDELISFDTPLAFIFSHSALREGWDNPNVFQLCTLKRGSSEIAKKQEIGRGLRLPVDIEGNRCFDQDINLLTVIANDHYDHFAEMLQKNFKEETGFDTEEVSYDVIQKALMTAGLPKEKVTPELIGIFKNELENAGILDDKNKIMKGKSRQDILYLDFVDPTLQEHQELIKTQFIKAMDDKGSQRIEIENGDEAPVMNKQHGFVSEKEFQSLWSGLQTKILQRTMYNVQIHPDYFIDQCIQEINKNLQTKRIKRVLEIATGKMDYIDADTIHFEDPASTKVETMIENDIEIIKSDFEMVNYWMQQTYLPRKALFKILEGIQKKPLLQIQDVLDECMKIILEKLTEQKVKHINYEMIDGFTFEVSDIFEMEDIKQEMLRIKRAYKTKEDFKHTIYEFIRVDSDGEYEFARNLDDDKDVLLFTKLKKGGLVIDTPYGGYSPDWAIIHRYREDSVKLYFIIETKCDKGELNLTEVEKVKINCAKKHFESLGANIIFDWVNGYERFKELVGEREANVSSKS